MVLIILLHLKLFSYFSFVRTVTAVVEVNVFHDFILIGIIVSLQSLIFP